MPRIGLLSDTHGHAATARRAVALLVSQQVDLMLHLGDVGSTAVLDALVVAAPGSASPLPVRVVFGNSDPDREELASHARAIGIVVDDPTGTVDLDGQQLVFTHGDVSGVINDAIDRGVRYICHGHTHRVIDDRVRRSRIINPGALYRAPKLTVAVLDTDADKLSIHDLPPRV